MIDDKKIEEAAKDLPNEIWKPVVGYEGLYEVSNKGRVKSLKRTIERGYKYAKQIVKECILKQMQCNGYLFVNLYKGGIRKRHYVHVLVAESFIPNPDKKPQVSHIDESRDNNCLDNLEWVTGLENCNMPFHRKRISEGLLKHPPMLGKKGELCARSRKVCQLTMSGELIRTFETITEAANVTGVCLSCIAKCCKGLLRWSGNYKWCYFDDYENIKNKPSRIFVNNEFLQKSEICRYYEYATEKRLKEDDIEFVSLKDLWHPASEKPRRNTICLAQIGKYVFDTFYDSENWVSYSKGVNITRWLYVDDLIPKLKEGDEQ